MSETSPPQQEAAAIQGRDQFVLVVSDDKTEHSISQGERLLALKHKVKEAAEGLEGNKGLTVGLTHHGVVAIHDLDNDFLFRLGDHLVSHPSELSFHRSKVTLDRGIVQKLGGSTEEPTIVGPGVDSAFEDLEVGSHQVLTVGKLAMESLVELDVPRARFARTPFKRTDRKSEKQVYIVSNEPFDTDDATRLTERAIQIRAKSLKKHKKDTASESTIRKRLSELRRDSMLGVFLLLFALFLHARLERSDGGQRLEMAAYDWLMGFVRPAAGDLPVTVVDFKENINRPAQALEVPLTDLDKLQKVVGAVMKYQPACIAIDVNFGPQPVTGHPSEMVYIDENSNFESSMVELQKQKERTIPIYLATTFADPGNNAILRDQSALPLAVHCLVPSDVRVGQILMYKELRKGKAKLNGLSQAVSDVYASLHRSTVEAPGLFVTPFVNDELADVQRSHLENLAHDAPVPAEIPTEKYFINYADKEALKNGALTVSKDIQLGDVLAQPLDDTELSRRITGKAVIIGSTTTTGDVFTEPRTDAQVQGLYVLALAADTRLHAPLYEFQLWIRTLLHILLGSLVLLTILGLRVKSIGHKKDLAASRLSLLLTAGVVGFTILMGIALVRSIHVIWTDYFLGILLLLLHPRVEHWIEKILEWFKHMLLAFLSKFAYNEK